jgi:ABC-type transport system involved in cytochrome bd biosynthesis fused ATPase/permease subunit
MTGRRLLLDAIRWLLPLSVAVAGIVAIVIGHGRADSPTAAAGVGLIIVALIVGLLNWMFRMSIRSNEEREDEERAREYFSRHGRWPDE